MKQTLDYLEHAPMSVTMCDREGIVVYQNETARTNDGNVVGRNMLACHSVKTRAKIEHMLSTGQGNTYAIIKNGKHHMVHHLPWVEEASGSVAGLIELVIPIPDAYPTFDRDAKKG